MAKKDFIRQLEADLAQARTDEDAARLGVKEAMEWYQSCVKRREELEGLCSHYRK